LAQLSPMVAETFSLSQDDRPRLNKEQSSTPAVPLARKERPDKPISVGNRRMSPVPGGTQKADVGARRSHSEENVGSGTPPSRN